MAGGPNTCFALSIPITSAASETSSMNGHMIRVREIVSAVLSGDQLPHVRRSTSCGANTMPSTVTALMNTAVSVATLFASRQADSSPTTAISFENVVMKAVDSAPSANKSRSKFGNRNAIRNASRFFPAPNRPANTISRIKPSTRLHRIAMPTTPVARVLIRRSSAAIIGEQRTASQALRKKKLPEHQRKQTASCEERKIIFSASFPSVWSGPLSGAAFSRLRFLLTDHGDFWQNAARGYSLRATQGKLDLDEIEKAYSLGSFSRPLQSSHITTPAGRKEKTTMISHKLFNHYSISEREILSPLWRGLLLILLLLVCFAFSQQTQAQTNTAYGSGALVSLTTGVWNSGFGFQALNQDTAGQSNTATGLRSLFSDTGGSNNTGTGVYALYSNTTGWYNNAVGAFALAKHSQGFYNTASGYAALCYNTANDNTSNGYAALFHNTTGESNTASGALALFSNTTGGLNTATGFQALYGNTTGDANMANGVGALQNNTNGTSNTANGASALFNNTDGDGNVAVGYQALLSSVANGANTKDGANVAVGFQALQNTNGAGNGSGGGNNAVGQQALQFNTTGFFNNAFGYQALGHDTTGAGNTAIGDSAGFNQTTGDNNVYIGAEMVGIAGENNACYIKEHFRPSICHRSPGSR